MLDPAMLGDAAKKPATSEAGEAKEGQPLKLLDGCSFLFGCCYDTLFL